MSVFYSQIRAAFSRHRLPPGETVCLDTIEKSDRYFLLHQASQFGPIFKAVAENRMCVCIVGLKRCRRFLHEHAANVRADTLKLQHLFPKGLMRQMEGPDHQAYRKMLVSAIDSQDLIENRQDMEDIVQQGLAHHFGAQDGRSCSQDAYYAVLNKIASGMLVKLFFGAEFRSYSYDRLLTLYRRLGPYGLVWNPGQQQESAFGDIRDYLMALVSERRQRAPSRKRCCILDRIDQANGPDETIVGNLIYMVEMGRYDMTGLFRWLTKYAADHPDLLDRIAIEDHEEPVKGKSLVEAFVLETLRTDQSERLIRIAQRDVVFDGYLIPKNAMVRLCLWESHKSSEMFAEPFEFNPQRFMNNKAYTSDQFSPFGLDHHRCPLAEMAIKMGITFLRILATEYSVKMIADGLPIRGAYHWEPARRFSVRLCKRQITLLNESV